MVSRLSWNTHNDFSKGISQDQPNYLIPDGFVYEARNMIITKTGQLRKRYGNSRHTSDASGLIPQSIGAASNYVLGAQKSTGYIAYKGVTGNKTIYLNSFLCTDAQSALTPLGPGYYDSYIKGIPGTPVSWNGNVIFPVNTPSSLAVGTSSVMLAAGGSDLSKINGVTGVNLGVPTVTLGNDTISFVTATALVQAGDYIYATSATNDYVGRVKEVLTSTSVRVDPTPTYTFVGTGCTAYSTLSVLGNRYESGTLSGDFPITAECIGIHQNRIVVGAIDTSTFKSSGKRNRIYWSTLLNTPSDSPVALSDGLVPFLKAGWPRRNYETFLNMNNIVGVVSLGPSTLLVLGDTGISLVSGTLGTVTADTTTSSYSVLVLSSSIGCVNVNSIQKTPNGVIFAAADGIYITDGNTFTNLTENKIQNLWKNSIQSGMTINGSAIIRNRVYALSTTTTYSINLGGMFFCDLQNNYAFTRTVSTNEESLPFSMSVNDPNPISNRVYVIGAYTDLVAVPNPQILRLDTIYPEDFSEFTLDYSLLDGTDVLGGFAKAGLVDVNNQKINARIQTRAYTEGDPNMLRRFRHQQFMVSVQDSDVFSSGIYVSYVMGSDPEDQWADMYRYTLGPMSRPSDYYENNLPFSARFDTNMNAKAISYIINDTDTYTASLPSWTLYEITLATNQLATGNTRSGLTPDSTSINLGVGTEPVISI